MYILIPLFYTPLAHHTTSHSEEISEPLKQRAK
jgi:hypothetical protein